jgi:hypothetical protein
MAAEQGNDEAQCWLGMMYAKGEGVKQNHYEAIKWFRKAADQGNDRALTYSRYVLWGLTSSNRR